MNRDKHIWEGWTVGDFIDDIELTFDRCAPFMDKQSLKRWVAQEQPYYKKHIPEVYNYFLKKGVAPEQARIVLPQSLMTEWIWTGSLVAFARVVKLRLSDDAQFECRAIAERIKSELDKQDKIKHSWSELCQ